MSIAAKSAGAWKEGSDAADTDCLPYVKHGGVWVLPVTVYCKKDGAWKVAWPEGDPGGGDPGGGTPGVPSLSAWDGMGYNIYRGTGGNAIFQFTVGYDGIIWTARNGAAATDGGTWLNGTNSTDFEISATGDFDIGTYNSWLDLAASQSWTADLSPVQVRDYTLSLQIRDKATQTIQTSATISLHAEAGT